MFLLNRASKKHVLSSNQVFGLEGHFFLHFFLAFFFWLLASGFWLLASGSFGFWLLACICCILEQKSLICVLFAAVWNQFACPFGFWLLALASLDSWLLVFGRTSVECMCSIVVCI